MAATNIALEIFAISITLLLLVCCLLDRTGQNKSARLFLSMLAVNLTVLGCDLFTWVFDSRADLAVALHIVNSLVYALGYVLTALFTCCLTSYVPCSKSASRVINLSVTAACVIAIVLVAVSYRSGGYFCYVDGVYTRGPLYWLSQTYPITVLLFDMGFILRFAKRLGVWETLSLLSYGILPAVALALQISLFDITLLYIATTLSLLIIYLTVYLRQARRLQRREMELQQARIAVMLSQIQPHFLYNALGAIQELCRRDPPLAEKAIAEFSEFLRGNLDSLTSDKPISFERELRHTQNYLAIEQLRFGSYLRVVYDIQTTMFRLPTLTLQPIVENAVRCGITKREEGGTVTIASAETDDAFTVTVSDDGVGFDTMVSREDGRAHIGIANVRERLARMCGGTLGIESTPHVGTVAVITLPKGGSHI